MSFRVSPLFDFSHPSGDSNWHQHPVCNKSTWLKSVNPRTFNNFLSILATLSRLSWTLRRSSPFDRSLIFSDFCETDVPESNKSQSPLFAILYKFRKNIFEVTVFFKSYDFFLTEITHLLRIPKLPCVNPSPSSPLISLILQTVPKVAGVAVSKVVNYTIFMG